MISKSIIKRIGTSALVLAIIMSQSAIAVAADEIIPMDEVIVKEVEATQEATSDIVPDISEDIITDITAGNVDTKLETTEIIDPVEEEQISGDILLGEGEGIFADAIQIGNAKFGPGEKNYNKVTDINTNSITSVVEVNTGADPDRPALGPEKLEIGKAYFQYNYNRFLETGYPNDTYDNTSSLYYYFNAPSDGEYTISMKAKNTYQLLLENISKLGDGASTNPFGKLTGNEELKQITVGLRKGLYLICAYADGKASYEDQIFIRVDMKEANLESDSKWIEMEPNNSYEEATHIPLDTLVSGSLYIGESSNSGYDYFKFDVPQRGIITLTEISNVNQIFVYDSTKTSAASYASSDLASGKYSKSIGVGAGTHYIMISGVANEADFDAAKYTFKIAFAPTDYSEIEPNDNYGQATAVEMNKTYWTSCKKSYDLDYFIFTLPSPKQGLKINFSKDMTGAQIDVKKKEGSIYYNTIQGKSFVVDRELDAGEYYVVLKLFDGSKITEDNNNFTFCIGGEVTDIQIGPTPTPTPTVKPDETPTPTPTVKPDETPTPTPIATPKPTPYPNKEVNPETNDGWGDIDDSDKCIIDPTTVKEDTVNITGIHDVTYTGTSVTFDLRVYKGTNLLKEGTDYSVKYVNNKLAWEGPSKNVGDSIEKQPTVVITGKGAYKAVLEKYVSENSDKLKFKISRINIENNMAVTTSNDTVIFQKNKKYKPVPIVTYNGEKLSNKKDYAVTYLDKNNNIISEYTEPGTYTIEINGIGNYAGKLKSTYTIAETNGKVLLSKAVIKGVKKSTAYTGTEIVLNSLKTQNFTFKAKINKVDTDLVENEDYTVRYVNNIDTGIATIIFTAKEGNTKNLVGEKYLTFKIAGTPLSKTKIELKANKSDAKETKTFDYIGKQVKPLVVVSTKGVSSVTLKEGEDYVVEYMRNINAGTALVYVRGIGAYEGTIKKSFKINPVDLGGEPSIKAELDGKSFKIENTSKYGIKVKVTFGGRLLTEGKDYTLSYKNNSKVGSADTGKSAPQVIIKGKGNFAKTIPPIPFDITE